MTSQNAYRHALSHLNMNPVIRWLIRRTVLVKAPFVQKPCLQGSPFTITVDFLLINWLKRTYSLGILIVSVIVKFCINIITVHVLVEHDNKTKLIPTGQSSCHD